MPTQTKKHVSHSVAPHAVFLAVAGLLALQGCNGAVSAEPASTASKPAATHATPSVAAASQIEAGRYLVEIGGCNDCHTPGYVQTNGKSPAEAEWLTGEAVGYTGPWGTSYPANLRLSFQTMSEEEFLTLARAGAGRPPMPWPSLMAMSDDDLKAIYAYIRHLGPRGQPAPAPLSPGVEPKTPHMVFAPIMPKANKS